MRVLVSENPRTVALASASHSLVFRQISGGSAPQAEVSIVSLDETTSSNGYTVISGRPVYGCLGLVCVQGQIFLAVISAASQNVARPLAYESVDRIWGVDFVALASPEWDLVTLDTAGMPVSGLSEDSDSETARVVHPCFEFKKLLSNGSFYYSNDFDLTSLLSTRGVVPEKLHATQNPDSFTPVNVKHYQEQYMWNTFLMGELLKFRDNLGPQSVDIINRNRFFTTVIRGFAKTVRIGGSDCITIISKQSWKRAGTRFNARGIDDDGNVANFVETEFIYNNRSSDQIFSFTQIRGSVPAFWEQDSTLINPKITITRSTEATQSSFDKHFREICKKYSSCHIVNLLSKTKTSEAEISRRYTDLLRTSPLRQELSYSHFDFHAETKPSSGGFAGATKILPMIRESSEVFGWFDYDTEKNEVVTRQNGVFRINCLDCLDRTNLIEQVICLSIVEHIAKDHSSSYSNRMRLDELTTKHNTLWADNGDAISQIYTGTNALKSSFSRSGKMNIAGALSDVTKSVSRMYQNTFVDGKKQSVIDTMLGKDSRLSIPVQIYDPINEYVTEKIKQAEATFTTYGAMTLFAGTFNVAAASPAASQDLMKWLFPPENAGQPSPDIYALGLQELIELNAGSILAADTSKPAQWGALFQRLLNSGQDEYLLLRTECIASMSLFFFVKKSSVDKVTEVSGSSKKTGMGGITANKGACAVRFKYCSTSFALVTSHLAAGVNATVERYNDYASIASGLSFTRNYTIGDHDNIIWFGDFNFRINLPNEQCRYLIKNGAFDELQNADQLTLAMRERGGAFHGFKEPRVLFYPTYKYDRGTSEYDSSEKQRVPSWTDRVVYRSKGNNAIRPINYSASLDVMISDHKPVFSTFQCKVTIVDEAKKNALSLQYYNAYKAEHGTLPEETSTESFANSTSTSFSSEALSELNLLELEGPAPKLPSRSNTLVNTLPRRVPPPPLSRKATPISASERMERSDSKPDQNQRKVPPVPPARNTPIHLEHLAFNSAPLVPTDSGSNLPSRTSSVNSRKIESSESNRPKVESKVEGLSDSPLSRLEQTLSKLESTSSSASSRMESNTSTLSSQKTETNSMKPMKPMKPQKLSSAKLDETEKNQSSQSQPSQTQFSDQAQLQPLSAQSTSAVAQNSAGIPQSAPTQSVSTSASPRPVNGNGVRAPPPPPARAAQARNLMADWQPMVPQ